MNLVDEYRNQSTWRNWEPYLEKLPARRWGTVYDMGCGIGSVTKMLAKKASYVMGIDSSSKLLREADRSNSARNIEYLQRDLSNLEYRHLEPADGIWSSFVAAYFPDFIPILNNWKGVLKKTGWMALVEMSGLFSHEPLSSHAREAFERYYTHQKMKNVYDFEMGTKLVHFVRHCGLTVLHVENMYDPELTFDGPADPAILGSWENRLGRME